MAQKTVKISPRGLVYLRNTKFLPQDLERIVATAETVAGVAPVLVLDRDTAERFREEFTVRLARVGFDQHYEPTAEGTLLEELIDQFAG